MRTLITIRGPVAAVEDVDRRYFEGDGLQLAASWLTPKHNEDL